MPVPSHSSACRPEFARLTYRSPDKPDECSRNCKLGSVKERSNALATEFTELTLDNLSGRQLRIRHLVRMAPDGIENIFSEPRLRLVEVGNAVDDGDGLPLSSARKQELWRFEEVEEEKAGDEHEEGECA